MTVGYLERVLPCLVLLLSSLSKLRNSPRSANLLSSEGCQSKDIDQAFDCEPPLMAKHVNAIEPHATM